MGLEDEKMKKKKKKKKIRYEPLTSIYDDSLRRPNFTWHIGCFSFAVGFENQGR